MSYKPKEKYLTVLVELENQSKKKTMLTVLKDLYDALYDQFGDAQEWLQNMHDSIVLSNSLNGLMMSRRALGDSIRREAMNAIF